MEVCHNFALQGNWKKNKELSIFKRLNHKITRYLIALMKIPLDIQDGVELWNHFCDFGIVFVTYQKH
jgi:hypothetical protein